MSTFHEPLPSGAVTLTGDKATASAARVVGVLSATSSARGLLIQAAVGSGGGSGTPREKRSGRASEAARNTVARCSHFALGQTVYRRATWRWSVLYQGKNR